MTTEQISKLKDAYKEAKLNLVNIKLAAQIALDEIPDNVDNREQVIRDLEAIIFGR